MTCAQCVGIEQEFNEKRVRRQARRIRRRGPSKTTQLLIDAIRGHGVSGVSVLDIGGGVGSIHLALLDAGADRAVSVDASTSYTHAAREWARDRGLRSRVTYVHGDFLDVADRLEDADIVTLDRVICCYHDVRGLVGVSAGRARRLYGLVYPRERWWTRVGVRAGNAYLRLTESPMRTFVHSQSLVESLLAEEGFTRVLRRTTPFWQVVLFERSAASG